ncbi:sigma-54 interaction domain-containing protein [Rheinheimera marina]|uniref:Sigma-54 interaction domain-containing protein n=1 Tax=Rheinheimera marina TaxID=1774958 RepID=A0ABV9JIF7_9GAMM
MNQARLFLHLHSAELSTQLLCAEQAKGFVLCQSELSQPWVEQLQASQADLALIEYHQAEAEQYQLLQQTELLSSTEFIFVSQGVPDPALDQLMRKGACYHFRQPLDLPVLLDVLQDFKQQFSSAAVKPKPLCSELDQFGLLVGSSPQMLQLYRTLRKVAPSKSNVLIIGESGAGKELVANTLHLASAQAHQPFVAINCGALSPELVDSELFGHVKGSFTGALRDHQGVFAQAKGGTLFLDEITEMPLEQQVKLLRVLETGEYRPVGSNKTELAEVRVVAATNRDPQQAIADGMFREDLYFRLAQFPLQVPSLRQRQGDIAGLARHFLAYCNSREQQHKALSTQAEQAILRYDWPGNVRELKHAIERAFILADNELKTEHLFPAAVAAGATVPELPVMPLEQLEKVAILAALERNQGNKTDTAQQLGISIKTLYNKLEKYQQAS